MIDPAALPVSFVDWPGGVRIIRSMFPPIDLFEDIADPADWPLLLSAEQKTNPRLMAGIGNLDLVPKERRVGGPGASYLMAPFTHISRDRPTRFSDGSFGILYVASSFEVALFETIYHHERFMASTSEPAGWTSQFREILFHVQAPLHDLRSGGPAAAAALHPDDYSAGQALGLALKRGGSEGILYPSVRAPSGECAALFHPDLAATPLQGRHLDYHWNGKAVDLYRDRTNGRVVRIL